MIHAYLDYASGRLSTSIFFLKPYSLPYSAKVGPNQKKIKKVCNILYFSALTSLASNLIIGLFEIFYLVD